MDRFFVAQALKFYKRREVQEAIVRHAAHREVSPRYGDGFGKRPDILENPQDVLEFAKRKATSFHCSEERWENPLQIVTGMPRRQADDLRIGWDLVLDIDAPDWDIARVTAWLFILALEQHGVKSISAKFSGNKGWHIGVPFESFQSGFVDTTGNDVHMRDLFPEMPRAIASYLVQYIGDTQNKLVAIDRDDVTFGGKVKTSFNQLAEKTGKQKQDLLGQFCPACNTMVDRREEQHGMFCETCGFIAKQRFTSEGKASVDDSELSCPRCHGVMQFYLASRPSSCAHEPSSYQQRFKINEVIEFDTVLLASRHLFRMPYSLHEKSGLVSVVVPVDDVLTFKKERAQPDTVEFQGTFLASHEHGDASRLASLAWEHAEATARPRVHKQAFDIPDEAIAEEHFPPCMQAILAGMRDGKKRAMFALVNFLQVSGWSKEMIEKKLHEWNERNPEPLREVLIQGHVKHHLGKSLNVLPPNCMQFYRELGVCNPDDLCRIIKNPAQYAVKKSKIR